MNFSRQMWSKSLRGLFLFSLAVVASAAPLRAQDPPRFQYVADGTLDTETGIVWGHYFREVDVFLTGQTSCRSWDFTMTMQVVLDWNAGEFITYQEFSDAMYGPVEGPEGIWRVPTRDELVEAVNAGLALSLDVSPAEGVQLFDRSTTTPLVWSSTEGGKKRGGFDSAYVVDIQTGETTRLTVASCLHGALAVRGAPAPDGGGPGQGGGNKK